MFRLFMGHNLVELNNQFCIYIAGKTKCSDDLETWMRTSSKKFNYYTVELHEYQNLLHNPYNT